LATAVALLQADQPSLVGFTDAGEIVLKGGLYEYYHTGICGGGAIKAAMRANVNLATLHLHKIDLIEITNSGTAAVTTLYVTTGTAVTEMHNCVDVTITDPNAVLVIGLGYVGGGAAHNIQGNHVDVIATANTSYGLYHNGTAIIRSAFNAIHAVDTGGASYAFYVGASATLNSHFDDLRSDDGNDMNGTLNTVSSESDGALYHTAFLGTVYYDNGNSGASIIIDWNNGNLQYVTLTAVGVDVTFTEPPRPGKCKLYIIQDGVGDRTIDWTHEVNPEWPGGVAPTLSTGVTDVDLIVFDFIGGTTYRGLFNGNFE